MRYLVRHTLDVARNVGGFGEVTPVRRGIDRDAPIHHARMLVHDGRLLTIHVDRRDFAVVMRNAARDAP